MKFFTFALIILLLSSNAFSQEIVKLGKRYSLMNDKHEVFSTEFDNIYVIDDYYYFQNGSKLGMIHKSRLETTDWDKFVTEYDLINNLNSGNDTLRFAVAKNGKFAVADKYFQLQSELIYDSVFVTRYWTGNIFFKLNGKLAFHPSHKALIKNNLVFEYDAVLPGDEWVTAYRKGNKYGFFTRKNQQANMIPPVFDSVPKRGDAFIETWINGKKTYYYSYDLVSYNSWIKQFELDLGPNTTFYNFYNEKSFVVPGPQRTERCFIEFTYLVVGNGGKPDFMVIDLSDGLIREEFQNPTAVENLVQLNYKEIFGSDSLLMIRVRTAIDDERVREVYYSLRNLEELVSVEISADETTVLKQCDWNYDFVALYMETEKGKAKKPYGFFEIERPGTFRRTKPMKDASHKNSIGGGGGGKWMDIFWMGGR